MSSTRASRTGDPALAGTPRAAASVTSAANAPRASPDWAAAALTSSNSSSVSENCTTFGRDTACRDRRRTHRARHDHHLDPPPSPVWWDRARSHQPPRIAALAPIVYLWAALGPEINNG